LNSRAGSWKGSNLNTDIAASLLVRWRLRDHVSPGATSVPLGTS
jgi:hypothetical protein